MRRGAGVILVALMVGIGRADAQLLLIDLINAVTKKVVVALDEKVQRMQTETIGLQIAAKEGESAMSQTELGEIGAWTQDQLSLFSDYYTELWQVKTTISSLQRLTELISRETQLVSQWKQVSAALRGDGHFNVNEVGSMTLVLNGILQQSERNVEAIGLVIRSFVTRMSDGERLRMIDEAGRSVDRNFSDLQGFYQQCLLLSLERAKDEQDLVTTRAMYGLE